MKETTFIYALCEPDSSIRTVRYIGKADNPKTRLQKHIYGAKHSHGGVTHKNTWIQMLLARGERPKLVVLREVEWKDWEIWEKRYIAAAKCLGFDLTNNTDGGGQGGYVCSPETCAKIGVVHRGKTVTLETREKQRQAHLGKKRTAESCAKTGTAARGNKYALGYRHTPEARAAISRSLRERPVSDETREKQQLRRSDFWRRRRENTTRYFFGEFEIPDSL